jgi:hypothetical protein
MFTPSTLGREPHSFRFPSLFGEDIPRRCSPSVTDVTSRANMPVDFLLISVAPKTNSSQKVKDNEERVFK